MQARRSPRRGDVVVSRRGIGRGKESPGPTQPVGSALRPTLHSATERQNSRKGKKQKDQQHTRQSLGEVVEAREINKESTTDDLGAGLSPFETGGNMSQAQISRRLKLLLRTVYNVAVPLGGFRSQQCHALTQH